MEIRCGGEELGARGGEDVVEKTVIGLCRYSSSM